MHSLAAMVEIYKQCDTLDIGGLNYFEVIKELLSEHKIPVISANHLYAERYPQQPTMWKTFTFKRLAERHFKIKARSSRKSNLYVLLSIGDSQSDHVAASETKRMLETENRLHRNEDIIRLIRIKLRDRPSIDHMIVQNEHLRDEGIAKIKTKIQTRWSRCSQRQRTDAP